MQQAKINVWMSDCCCCCGCCFKGQPARAVAAAAFSCSWPLRMGCRIWGMINRTWQGCVRLWESNGDDDLSWRLQRLRAFRFTIDWLPLAELAGLSGLAVVICDKLRRNGGESAVAGEQSWACWRCQSGDTDTHSHNFNRIFEIIGYKSSLQLVLCWCCSFSCSGCCCCCGCDYSCCWCCF